MNIIITGASRGIGFELAKHFAAKGNHKIVAIARSSSKLKELKNACIRENIEAHLYPIAFDLTSIEESGKSLVDGIKSYLPSIDILINNAGFLSNKSLQTVSSADFWQMVKVNFTSPALLIKTLTPMMSKGSHIVNISSMGGFQGSTKFEGLSVYSATKAAIASLTECLALELKGLEISVNCLALGAVNTEMLAEAFPGYNAPVSATTAAEFITNFALTGHSLFNGKVLPVSISTP